jgi:hypothetical protein
MGQAIPWVLLQNARGRALSEIGDISFERLSTLLHQGVEMGLRMLPLSRLNPLLPELSPFMLGVLEVVNSPAESPKCVATQNKQEPKTPFETIDIGQSGVVKIGNSQGRRQVVTRCFSSGQTASG